MQHQDQPQPGPGPESIDFAFTEIARRRLIRERVSIICAGAIVTAMVVTFYRILAS
jgi:hypothetical protein